MVFIGIAQEKATVPRTIRKRFGEGEGSIPWIDFTTAMVNFYYFYCVDEDFGPFFSEVLLLLPLPGQALHQRPRIPQAPAGQARDRLRGSRQRPAELRGTPARPALANGFNEHKIERFFRKWLARLPHPFPAADRKAGYRYQLSILQAEFALTQVWDRPVHGREFFEQVIRENIDLGRPEQVQLIFARKMHKKTATDGRCRTRIVTEGVIPSLHVYYKNTHLKQYHKTWKKGAALRTETTINNSYDFGVGRLIKNLPTLRESASRPTGGCWRSKRSATTTGSGRWLSTLQKPVNDEGQRASALRFGDRRVQALFAVLVLLSLKIEGFRNRQLRPLLAQMLGLEEDRITQGKMTYDLRRLRLHGLIERIEKTHRYRLTQGLAVVHFYQRTYARLLRPALSVIDGGSGIAAPRKKTSSGSNQPSTYLSTLRLPEKLTQNDRLRRFKDSRTAKLSLAHRISPISRIIEDGGKRSGTSKGGSPLTASGGARSPECARPSPWLQDPGLGLGVRTQGAALATGTVARRDISLTRPNASVRSVTSVVHSPQEVEIPKDSCTKRNRNGARFFPFPGIKK